MTIPDAIAFLRSQQPMPSDRDISAEEDDAFMQVLKLFENTPQVDRAWIPLLVGPVSSEDVQEMAGLALDVLRGTV